MQYLHRYLPLALATIGQGIIFYLGWSVLSIIGDPVYPEFPAAMLGVAGYLVSIIGTFGLVAIGAKWLDIAFKFYGRRQLKPHAVAMLERFTKNRAELEASEIQDFPKAEQLLRGDRKLDSNFEMDFPPRRKRYDFTSLNKSEYLKISLYALGYVGLFCLVRNQYFETFTFEQTMAFIGFACFASCVALFSFFLLCDTFAEEYSATASKWKATENGEHRNTEFFQAHANVLKKLGFTEAGDFQVNSKVDRTIFLSRQKNVMVDLAWLSKDFPTATIVSLTNQKQSLATCSTGMIDVAESESLAQNVNLEQHSVEIPCTEHLLKSLSKHADVLDKLVDQVGDSF